MFSLRAVKLPVHRLLCQGFLLIVVLLVYCWPTLKARAELGSTLLPPEFAPDLTMYLALSNPPMTGTDEFENPYYLVPVAHNSTGYLKFHLAPGLFAKFRAAFPGHLWICMLVWNCFWWALLGGLAIYLFGHYLPGGRLSTVILGVTLLMLFNFTSLKPLIAAWVHLPSLAGFDPIQMPFLRAFIPVVPVVLLLAYLALQIEVSRKVDGVLMWFAMGVLQFLALAIFPYATLMMAGITAMVLLVKGVIAADHKILLTVLVYGSLCGVVDVLFARSGSLGFYGENSALIHFQPSLLPHLVGGNWLLLASLTLALALGKGILPEVRWPLVGLATTNLLLMLGDAIVPAKLILLSHHAGHFVQTSTALLLPFALVGILSRMGIENKGGWVLNCAIGLVIVNGFILSNGVYRFWRRYNLEVVELANTLADRKVVSSDDLVIAPSQNADDLCGWIYLLSKSPVLYCTDAQVMLSPQQNFQIHHFRQAIYLYLTGSDSGTLQQALAGSNRLNVMYRLGYWAEAASLSSLEQGDGVQAIKSQLFPWLKRVEGGDSEATSFFRRFHRVIVIDNLRMPVFAEPRLEIFLRPEAEQETAHLKISTYLPK